MLDDSAGGVVHHRCECPQGHQSGECSACGRIDAASRISPDVFRCAVCGHAEHADLDAAKTIRNRG